MNYLNASHPRRHPNNYPLPLRYILNSTPAYMTVAIVWYFSFCIFLFCSFFASGFINSYLGFFPKRVTPTHTRASLFPLERDVRDSDIDRRGLRGEDGCRKTCERYRSGLFSIPNQIFCPSLQWYELKDDRLSLLCSLCEMLWRNCTSTKPSEDLQNETQFVHTFHCQEGQWGVDIKIASGGGRKFLG